MITNIPPQFVSTPPKAQMQLLPTSEADLSRDDLSMSAKAAILCFRVQQVIQQNDTAGVTTTGVQIVDLQTNRTLVTNEDETEQFAASINKLPVMLLVMQDLRSGSLNLDQVMTWQASDVRGGFGVYDQPGAPLQATLREVIFDLLNRSGNTAVRIIVNGALGGAAAVNDRWADIPQLSHTYLQPLDSNRFFLGFTTPSDSLWTMEKLMAKQDAYTSFIRNAMATNIFTDISVRSQLAGNNYILLVNKVGLLDDVDGNNRHDVGIIYNQRTHKSYAYSLMTTSPFTSTTATPQAEQSLKDIGRLTLRYAGDKAGAIFDPLMPKSLVQQQPVEQGKILY